MTAHTVANGAGLVVELAALNQARAQDLLTDPTSGHRAPALLRTWNDVIAAAADLWDQLPAEPGPTKLLMQRLTDLTFGMDVAIQDRDWPTGVVDPDHQLLRLADTFTHAAELIHTRQAALTPGEPDQVRAATTAAIHFAAHAVHTAATRYAADAARHTPGIARERRRPHSDLIGEAANRMLGVEQLSAHAAGGHHRPHMTDTATTPEDRRLATSLAIWDVQSHRTLARQPTVANLYLIARTHGAIGQLGAALLHSRAVTTHIGADDHANRVLTPLADATGGWHDLAVEWRTMLTHDTATQFDPDLVRTSQNIRDLAHRLTSPRHGAADPAYALAFTIDLGRASHLVHDSLAHSAEIARAARELATADPSPLRGDPNHLTNRARQLGDTEYTASVYPRDPGNGRSVRLPAAVRGHIANLCNQITAHSLRGLTASTILDPESSRRPATDPEKAPSQRRSRSGRPQPAPLTGNRATASPTAVR